MTAEGRPGDRVFVYGTLKPGHLRWPHLAPHVVAHRIERVRGLLYDTGHGWPAAVFESTDDRWIHGVVADLDPDRRAEVWELLDAIEGPDYRRVTVRTEDGVVATSYEIRAVVPTWRRLDGRWDRP